MNIGYIVTIIGLMAVGVAYYYGTYNDHPRKLFAGSVVCSLKKVERPAQETLEIVFQKPGVYLITFDHTVWSLLTVLTPEKVIVRDDSTDPVTVTKKAARLPKPLKVLVETDGKVEVAKYIR